MAEQVYQSALTEAVYLEGSSDHLVVSFTEKSEPPPAQFFGARYFNRRAINALIIRTRKNVWWQSPDVILAIEAMARFASERGFEQRYGYGASMGSYGVLQFSARLGLSRIILMGPVASVDPAIDNRWYSDIAAIAPEDLVLPLTVETLPAGCQTFALYDPRTLDKTHVDHLGRFSEVHRISVPFAGHNIPGYLLSAGILSELVDALLAESPDGAVIERLIEDSNERNWRFLHAQADAARNDPAANLRLCERALSLAPDEPITHYKLAQALSRNGALAAALEHLRYVEDGDSSWLLSHNFADAAAEFTARGGQVEAIDDLFALFRSDRPRSRQSQLAYSRFLRVNKRFEEAFAAHEQFLKEDAFSAHAYFERGLIYEEQGERDLALRQYELAREANPLLSHYQAALDRLRAELKRDRSQ